MVAAKQNPREAKLKTIILKLRKENRRVIEKLTTIRAIVEKKATRKLTKVTQKLTKVTGKLRKVTSNYEKKAAIVKKMESAQKSNQIAFLVV
jgi:hypothetical protein